MSASIIIIIVLMIGVIFVNGWTDAPNAIATVISTRVLTPRIALWMAVVFNFLGTLIMTYISKSVAETLSAMVDYSNISSNISGDPDQLALITLAASMFSIVIWAVAAWAFGIPTSESHALIAGVTGGAIALGGFSAINIEAWKSVLIGLGVSSILGFFMGFIVTKIIHIIGKNMHRQKANRFFEFGQIGGAASMAFMHGAQDGQKFMGIFLLGLFLYNKSWVTLGVDGSFEIPFWLVVLCSATMGIGTSIGGYRIIKAVGMDMVNLEKYQGFAADLSASICLLISSLTGIPVSTTHTKTTAIMGVGAAKRFSSVNWGVAGEMIIAWILTFPGCGLIAYVMSKLFMQIF